MKKSIDSEIFELIFALSKNIKEKMAYFSKAGNITMPQFIALSYIGKNGAVQMKDIASYFAIEMPTASALINKLARLSLVMRVVDSEDRRIVRVSLSKKGEELLLYAKKIQEENTRKMLSYLSGEQKESMRDILAILVTKQKNI
jgi:DNA-binding MarR family transcriptional regulator